MKPASEPPDGSGMDPLPLDTDPRDRRRSLRHAVAPMYHGVSIGRTAAPVAEEATTPDPDGHVYDLSVDGARLEVDDIIDPGESVALRLHLPGGDDVAVEGRIVRSFAPEDDPAARRVAVQFTHYRSDTDQRRLARYLGQLPGPRRGLARAA